MVPEIPSAGEMKTKPTQHSVKVAVDWDSTDILVCRAIALLIRFEAESVQILRCE